jgi:hypothetical protein
MGNDVISKPKARQWFWITLGITIVLGTINSLVPHIGGFTTYTTPLYTPEPMWATSVKNITFIGAFISTLFCILFAWLWWAHAKDEIRKR